MRLLSRRFLAITLAIAPTLLVPVLAPLPSARAAVFPLISSQPANSGTGAQTRSAGDAILSVVAVGAAPVSITSFGTFGQLPTAGNLKWVIFQGAPSFTNISPVFSTAATPRSGLASGLQWYDSPDFTFTLLANTTYQLGLFADQNFTYTFDIPGTAVTSNGLTLVAGSNGNGQNFATPITAGLGGALNSVRIFGPSAAPEPGSLALLGMTALPAVGFVLRRCRA